MFATLFQNLIADARRIDIATFDDRLLDDVGLERRGMGLDRVDLSEVAASSAFPIHDVWSPRPVIRIVEPLNG